ncbi:MAG: hypothetical protein AAGD07_17070 [Planctomycetota bacterium]
MCAEETILAILPGTSESERVVVVQYHNEQPASGRVKVLSFDEEPQGIEPKEDCDACEHCGDASHPIVLRQESFSPAVGWFTQSCVQLSTHQWAAMRYVAVPAQAPDIRAARRHPGIGAAASRTGSRRVTTLRIAPETAATA